MTLADVDGIMDIERASFPSAWPARAYRYELLHNAMAHYYVVRAREQEPREAKRKKYVAWLRRSDPQESASRLAGYGGFWLMGDEAHISTIAIHPSYRRRGFARKLMLHMLDEAIRLGAHLVTLEVRVSNVAAQQLYAEMDFVVVGKRKRYYQDNREDALIMTVKGVERPGYAEKLAQWKKEGKRLTQCVWRGWQRLQDMVALWRVLHPQTCE
ncbi:MAG: ribosomal protein S18-alanine N-acetyltransferase [Chloroflexi bacterium]|nr:ribosomal protein S18-alanine N-acetyltransferase [Chloroflexota bacterium]